jgi:hypothetical protein
MRNKIFGGIAVLAIAAVAAWNVSVKSQPSYKLSDTMLANLEALAAGENAGSDGWTWNCSTYTSETYDQTTYEYECGRSFVSSHWETRSCNNGILTWCYPGYITTYYNCDGTVSSVNDRTYISGCN